MLATAIEIYDERQHDFCTFSPYISDRDKTSLFDAAKRHHERYLNGETRESLEDRLARALNRAEAHSWNYERPHPHPTGQHFGAHLGQKALPTLESTDEVEDYTKAQASEIRHPNVRWHAESQEWVATRGFYFGETFPVADISPFL
jgi:hypothetical protein